jgi:MFS family permease
MLFITVGEMFIFPFSNAYALSRAPKGQEGKYMAFFTMSFSLAHIGSSKVGMEIVSQFGYNVNWIFMGLLGVSAVIICRFLTQK